MSCKLHSQLHDFESASRKLATMETLLVTGGAGFIGAAYVRQVRNAGWARVINLDSLTYASDSSSLPENDHQHLFVHGDILDRALIDSLLKNHQPMGIVHFAAESHVDRSIDRPIDFVKTNVLGTVELLDACYDYWRGLDAAGQNAFRFVHISTDEVYGSLEAPLQATEDSPYMPSSPYAASKAAADMFVQAYHRTYGLPVIVTNCTNNYGPNQYPEKLIPFMIMSAATGGKLPLFGDGLQVRDWLHVEDHCRAIDKVLRHGKVGSTYLIGGGNARTNLEVVRKIAFLVDQQVHESRPLAQNSIEFVADRPGHDRRYAIDTQMLHRELGWAPSIDWDDGIAATVDWYLTHLPRMKERAKERSRQGLSRF